MMSLVKQAKRRTSDYASFWGALFFLALPLFVVPAYDCTSQLLQIFFGSGYSAENRVVTQLSIS